MLDREFGKFRFVRRLGRGGMADVYLARDTAADRDVALKIVEVKQDRDSLDILDAERRGAILQDQFCRVDSHVPLVHEYGRLGDYFYLDMEYVDGEDLAEMIGRGPIEPTRAASIAGEICAFLEKAHVFDAVVDERPVHGIIHADIKPKNVRLNVAGQVKVLDFGIAKGLALSRKLTRNDFGSLAYLSPERLDSGDVDGHVDLWSVGTLLYEMIAGVPPFVEANAQTLERLIRSRQQPPPLPDGCPAAMQRIIAKMLAGDLGRRYQAAAEIRSDLDRFVAGIETQADREWLSPGTSPDATRRTTPVDASDVAPDVVTADGEATRLTRRETVAADQATRNTRGTAVAEGATAPDDDATRRTRRPEAPPMMATGPGTSTAGVVGTRSAVVPRLSPRARRVVVTTAVVLITALIGNEAIVWSAARDLRASLPARQGTDMAAAWNEYERLAHRSLLGFGLLGVRTPLKERLVAQAERVMSDYRQDAPAVREAQWKAAAEWLTCASRLDPSDAQVSASLQYCEGHIARIAGEAQRRKKLATANQSFHEAVARFQEAGRLNRKWPDPYLGLARTYIYGLDDLDRAIAAFDEARRRGYQPGNRELVQMADGYRSRAERWRRESGGMQGLPQQADLLQKAVDDYAHSIDLYRQAIGFGDAGAYMRQVQKRLDEVQQTLTAVKDKGTTERD
jgi:tetratricopeptide (TPR) repeat protein